MTGKRRDHDLVVAGAGFAGLACAGAAAARGLRTLVLERQAWPGTRVRTTGILVRELAEQWDPPSRLLRRIERVRLYSPRLRTLDLESPHYYFLASDTRELMRWHMQQAVANGATIRFASPYLDSYRHGDRHIVNCGAIRARFLGGCDGSRSRVARDHGLGRNRHFLIGAEAELAPLPRVDPSCLHVFLDGELAPGYIGWVVPGVHATQAGLGCRLPRRPDLQAFLEKIRRVFRTDRLEIRGRRAGLIPCGGPVRPWAGRDVLLLGDAAGLVSPLTAGGIHPAVQIGRLAGSAIADYLDGTGPDPARAVREHLPSWFWKSGMRRCLDQAALPDAGVEMLFDSPAFRAAAQTVFFHNRGLFCAAAWRDLLRVALDR